MTVFMNIGQAACKAGVSAKMIRNYEEIGLLPPAARTEAGYRQYTEGDVSVLRFIRHARRFGFSIRQVASLLEFRIKRAYVGRDVETIVQGHVDDLRERIQELTQQKQSLDNLIRSCHGDAHAGKKILEGLVMERFDSPESRPMPSLRSAAPRTSGNAHRPRAMTGTASTNQATLVAWARNSIDQHEAPHLDLPPVASPTFWSFSKPSAPLFREIQQ
jgi:Cu(I)-responsive transcriptional regulator